MMRIHVQFLGKPTGEYDFYDLPQAATVADLKQAVRQGLYMPFRPLLVLYLGSRPSDETALVEPQSGVCQANAYHVMQALDDSDDATIPDYVLPTAVDTCMPASAWLDTEEPADAEYAI
ncbi:hypothetical protein [Caldimonas brevitalea]|uniref:Ubiquitin-like domain-containing protein n=1 Tax=Caldimonas brevitalea TaxID=413882 RepID=A0A0G3BKK6_9BURK|nr:hypothetical protein [Caldimonas brevitalea]AKJ28523.1 hypothetical protein AAW51_1832 [Caldimonas brevitalea]